MEHALCGMSMYADIVFQTLGKGEGVELPNNLPNPSPITNSLKILICLERRWGNVLDLKPIK